MLVFLGLTVRLPYVAGADFPLNDGGLSYAMMHDLRANHLMLPAVTSYNLEGIPFVYPPFAIYLGTVVELMLGAAPTEILLWLPLILSVLCVPAMALLGRSVLRSPAGGFWAGAAFALLPSAYIWQIMGAGLTRSAGFLFGILTLWQAHEILSCPEQVSKWRIAVTGILSALTVLSHPALPIPVATGIALMWLGESGEVRSLLQLLAAALGALALAAPWLALVLVRFGIAPWRAAAATAASGGVLHDPSALLLFDGEASPMIFMVLAVVGAVVAVVSRKWFLPAWLVVLFVVDPHGAIASACIPLAILTSLGIVMVVLPGIRTVTGAAHERSPGASPSHGTWLTRSRGAVALASAAVLGIGLLGNVWVRTDGWSPLKPLPPAERQAMQWISRHTPPNTTFVVLGPARHWYDDSVGEWFPALAHRHSVTTAQGSEWLPGGVWGRRCRVRRELIQKNWESAGSFFQFVQGELGPVGGVYLSAHALRSNPALARLARLLTLSPAARLVFSSPGAAVFIVDRAGRPATGGSKNP